MYHYFACKNCFIIKSSISYVGIYNIQIALKNQFSSLSVTYVFIYVRRSVHIESDRTSETMVFSVLQFKQP